MLEEFGRSAARGMASLPAHLAFHLTNLPPVSAQAERRHIDSLRRNLMVNYPLPHEAAVVAALDRDGVFVTDLDALGLASSGEDDILAHGEIVAARLAARAAAMGEDRPEMMVSKPGDLVGDPSLYRWGLNAVLLRIAEAYLRQPVAYDGALVFHTAADGREAGTRRWHLDREDRRVLKVGLYLNDVDEDGGPFQMIGREVHRTDGRFSYRVLKNAIIQQKFLAEMTPGDIVTCTGKRGSLVFADAARYYHRGKPATGRDRRAVFFGYFARPPCHPFFCDRSRLTRRQIATMTEGLHRTQRLSALWRGELSWLARMIPPSLN